MWDGQHIPHSDPYSFTAPGKGWVVQSWLASFLYGAADRLWGPGGILLLVAVTSTLVGLLVWKLTRDAGTIPGRFIIMIPVLVIAIDGGWVERPLLFGLVAFGLVLLAAQGRLDPRWLVPVMWFWVNVHGSFPLGLVALGALAVGQLLDERAADIELAALKWAVVGTLAGAVSPLGPRLLVFPIELLRRQDVLSNVIEWQAPAFTQLGQRLFLVEVGLAIAMLARRPSWRAALPLVVFLAAALLGARNVVIASIMLVPGLAAALPSIGTLRGEERRPIFRPMVIALGVVSVLAAVVAVQGPVYTFNGYPVAAVTWAEDNGVLREDARIVARDFVGNYLELRYGTKYKVFLDDRYDMFPASLVEDFVVLNDGSAGWQAVLDRYGTTAVLWQTGEALGQHLAESPRWRVVYTDQEFLIAVPR